jgi:acyl transferase domain-containing protein
MTAGGIITCEPIAIIGMAGRFPGAPSIGEFWKNLVEGVASIRFFDEDELREAGVPEKDLRDSNYVRAGAVIDDVEWFDAALFGVSPREAEILDPQHRIFLETCHSALQDAAYDPAAFEGRIGLYAGARNNEYLSQNLKLSPAVMRAVGETPMITSNHTDYLATSVAYRLNLRGPAISAVTACSTSLVAVHMACWALRTGECEIALAGGVEVALPPKRGYLYSEGGISSPDATVRPFDANARGTVFGSGSGAVVLRRLSDALADNNTIHAVILGSAINNDGSAKTTFATPGEAGQTAALAAALNAAGVDPASIGYVEAHGTGTMVGDPVEVAALTNAYGSTPDHAGRCALASVKGNVGHLGAAAGICGLIKAVCCVREGILPPSLNFDEPNPRIDFAASPFHVNSTLSTWPEVAGPRRAGVSSFGIGGTNAHLILEQPPDRPAVRPARRPYQLLTLSARTGTALDTATAQLAARLPGTGADLADVAYTLNVGRPGLPVRRFLVARDSAEAAARLADEGARLATSTLAAGVRRGVAFMFPGQGAQHLQMGRGLYASERGFADTIDWCAKVLDDSHGLDLLALMFPEAGDAGAAVRLNQTAAAQPALFAVEFALALLVREWGIEPSVMIGHSIGEYVAASLAGVMEAEDALRLVAERGALVQTLPPGAMLAVMLPEEMLLPLLPDEVELAAVNAPGACVVSGPTEDVRQFRALLTLQGIGSRPLHTSHAFHSRMMDPILDTFRERVSAVKLTPPSRRYMSNLTGTWIAPDEATDPGYWVHHLRDCVRFSDAAQSLVAEGGYVFAETGPGQSLAALVSAHANTISPRSPAPVTVPLMRRPDEERDDLEALLEAAGRIWAAGAPVSWKRFWSGVQPRRVPLPAYPYERERFWVERDASQQPDPERSDADDGPFYVPTWRETPLSRAAADEAGSAKTLWLVLSQAGDAVAGGAARLLREAGAEVLTAEPGSEFSAGPDRHYTLRIGESADYGRLLEVATEMAPERIRFVHALAVGGKPGQHGGAEHIGNLLDQGFFSVLTVLRETARLLGSIPVELCIVTSDAQDVTGDMQVEPAKAAVLGLVKVIPKEFSTITCRSVDISARARGKLAAAQLFAELRSGAGDVLVAYRGRKRWAWSYAGVRLDAPDGMPAALTEHGVYLITGGLGALGLALARQLAELARARLVLVGRSGLPDRAQWPAILAAAGSDDVLARRLRAVQAVEEAGGQVLTCPGDVTDEARMREIRAEAEHAFGPVDGIFHLAGIPGGGQLETRSDETARQVLSPKVAGTYVLDKVFRPGLLVLYSSVAVINGDYGLGDYAAANAVLDAFAHSRWAENRHVVAINWAPWKEIGMAHEIHGPAIFSDLALGLGPATPTTHPLLRTRRDRADGSGDLVVFDIDMTPAQWVLAEHLLNGVPTMPGTGIVELACAVYREAADSAAAEIRDLTLLRPLAAEPSAQVRAELRRRGDDGFDFSIAGRAPGQPEAEYARGRIYPASPGERPRHDLAEVRKSCPDDTTPGPRGSSVLKLGPRWDNITCRVSGPGTELVSIQLPGEFVSDAGEFILHPAVLDSAGGLGMSLAGEGMYLPFSYSRITVRSPLPGRCHSIIMHLDDTQGEIVQASMIIVDDDGTELVAVEGYTLVQVAVPQAAGPATGEAVPAERAGDADTAARLDAADLAPATPAEADGDVSPAEGAQALLAVLASRIGPQVIVCPGGIQRRDQRASRITRAALVAYAPTGGTARARALATPYAAPESEAEQLLTEIWRDAVGIDEIGVDDDFLELGGNSLVAVQLAAQISERFRASVSVAQLFESRTIRGLAEAITTSASGDGDQAAPGRTRTLEASA